MAGKSVDIASVLGAQLRDVPESGTAEMQWIETERIVDNSLNFYPRPTNAALGELMESIEANGLLEPPTVIQNTGTLFYRLISGHSRMEAIRMLQSGNPTDERWQKVLCRVLPQMDKDQELAAVIEANRQRIKSGALLAREAESLTAAYIRRREAGEDLPGRIRDRVAEALQINKTKLSNLKVIKEGLKVPGFHRLWEEEKITESAALEIARMDLDDQYRLLDWHIDKNRELITSMLFFGTATSHRQWYDTCGIGVRWMMSLGTAGEYWQKRATGIWPGISPRKLQRWAGIRGGAPGSSSV
ncbi:ParB/RepB/Spo0J family partition protein [Dysosmobacter sp.]